MQKFFNIFNNKSIAKSKYEQIIKYYEFHKNIESYFNEGYNIEANSEKKFFYFIDSNWVKSWKSFINYKEVISNIDYGYEYMISDNILNNDYDFNFAYANNGRVEDIFLNKLLYKLEDFDCLIDADLFILFYDFYPTKFKNCSAIEGIFYDKMLVLIINKQRRIKIIYKGQLENNFETIQLNIDFPKKKSSNDNLKELFNIITGKNNDCYYNFQSEYLNRNCENLMNLLLEKNIGFLSDVDINKDGKNICHISNNNLYKKYKRYIPEKLNFSKISLNKPRFIGLKNIGATCYMNAILQCLVNIKQLTKYLLNNHNFFFIIDNADKCEILSCYCILLEKLCCDQKVKESYSPYNFKEIISRKNPLFEGVNPNDSKDLFYFLLEEMNYEFNQISLKIKNNINCNINLYLDNINKSNKNLILKKFIKEYSLKNNNIIPELFFSIVEIEIICKNCHNYNYNYQTIYSLEFNLEKIYDKIYGQENFSSNKKILSLDECLLNYNETYLYKPEDGLYCAICKCPTESIYNNRIYSLSPILIIILNREKDNKFKCDVDFPENINISKYIQCPESNYNYSLIGIVSHLGSMSGHFISYCKHLITNEWYCYNDEIVSRCEEQFNNKRKGTPYILIYESTQENKNILFYEDFPKNEKIIFNNYVLNNNLKNNNNIVNLNNSNNINYQYIFNNNIIKNRNNNFKRMNINDNMNFNKNMKMINNMNNIRINKNMNNMNNLNYNLDNNSMNNMMVYNIFNNNENKNKINSSMNKLVISNMNNNNMNKSMNQIMSNNMNNNNMNQLEISNMNNNNNMNKSMNQIISSNMNNKYMNNSMNNLMINNMNNNINIINKSN